MNIWSEMMTALKGGIDGLGESMKTSQVIEILTQQILQIEMDLQQSKENLATSLIQQKQAEKQVKILRAEIIKYEGYAVKALEQNEELALEVAEQIAILETELTNQKQQDSKSNELCKQLRQDIRKSEQDLLRIKHQRDTVRASSNVQNAQENMTEMSEQKNGLSKPQTARDVLERIKKHQAELGKQTEDNDLQAKLKKAGIIDSNEDVNASSILDRIKGNGKS